MKLKKRFYPWHKFLADVYEKIIPALGPRVKEFDGVWGPHRGGWPLAVILSYNLGLPCRRRKPKSRKTLIVDDIADTGKTLRCFKGKNTIVTLFYYPRGVVTPDLWLHKKKSQKEWIVFPWDDEAKKRNTALFAKNRKNKKSR